MTLITSKQLYNIAKFATTYLKNRMMINQKIISKNDNRIDFDTFMKTYNNYLKIIEYVEEHPEENEETVENQISYGEKVMRSKMDYVRLHADSVVMTEEQIDELMGYIRESISYGLKPKSFYNETFFIREMLEQLIEEIKKNPEESSKDKLKRIENFLAFVRASDSIGFCENLGGFISYEDDKFLIISHNSKRICKIDKQGRNSVENNELVDEDIYLPDNMYVGYLESEENITCIFLEKIINGKRMMKAISTTQELFPVSQKDGVVLYSKINDFFTSIGTSFLISDIYTEQSLKETIEAYNAYNELSLGEREELDNIAEIATSWWVNNYSSPSFDSGIEGEIIKSQNELMENYKATCKPTEKEIKKFKEILGNRIKILLLSRFSLLIHTDYRPEGELEYAIKKSKLNASFPIKNYMDISRDRIKVKKSYNSPYEEIYSKKVSPKR